jgi:cytochrome c oxidase cbb3-type subunit 4
MDVNVIGSVVTVVMFAAFVGIVIWAWSGKRKRDFEQAANLPFIEDGPENTAPKRGKQS